MNQNGEPRIPSPGGFEQVTIAGKTWKISRINPSIREEFSLWVMQQAYERLERLRKKIPSGDYLRRLKSLDASVDSGAYDWGFQSDENSCGSAIWNARMEGEGPTVLAKMLLKEHHGDVSPNEIAEVVVAEEKAAQAENRTNRFQDAVMRALDPNSVSPPQQAGSNSNSEKANA